MTATGTPPGGVAATRSGDPTAPADGADGGSLLRGAILVLVPLLLAAWCIALTRDLWVMTEARAYLHGQWDIDPLRLLLLPRLEWGGGRSAGIALFGVVGKVCDLDSGCVNLTTALLTATGAVLVLVHGWQLSGSALLGLAAAALWGLSAPVLATWLWQATWFDLLAAIAALSAGILWWWTFGRRVAGVGWWALTVLGSLAVLVVALNAKEVDALLLGVLPLLAVVRGAAFPGAVRRNLLAAVVPLVYGGWFVIHALLNADPVYAASATGGSIVQGLRLLITQGLGVGASFALIDRGPGATPYRVATAIAWAILGLALLVAGVAAWRRSRGAARAADPATSGSRGRALLLDWGAELYLLLLGAAITLLGARSAGASAYYLVTPAWAFVLLLLLLMRRIVRASARPRRVGAVLAGLLVAAWVIAYAGHLADGAAVWRLRDDSAALRRTATLVRTLLAGRPVTSVAWAAEGPPATAFHLLRDPSAPAGDGYRPTTDSWPWLMGEKQDPPVTSLDPGSAVGWRDRVAEHAGPGEVLLVTDDRYGLALLAFEGRVLYPPPAP